MTKLNVELSHETDVVIALQEWSTYHQRLAVPW